MTRHSALMACAFIDTLHACQGAMKYGHAGCLSFILGNYQVQGQSPTHETFSLSEENDRYTMG